MRNEKADRVQTVGTPECCGTCRFVRQIPRGGLMCFGWPPVLIGTREGIVGSGRLDATWGRRGVNAGDPGCHVWRPAPSQRDMEPRRN